MIFTRSNEEAISFEPANQPSSSAQIFVDVAGAVVNPGVYELKAENRLQEGLIAAGGLSAQADRDWVARNLNLAVKLKDGAKIYIPKIGEGTKSTTGIAGTGEVSTSGLVNINTASLSQLDKLPGIGPVTGQKIIDNRPYSDINELLTKKVVGNKVFEQIKEKITVY